MLNQLKQELADLKLYYDNGIMVSLKESISGISICEKILIQLKKLEAKSLSEDKIINKLNEFLKQEMEHINEETEYVPTMSSQGYDLSALTEIKKVLKKYSCCKIVIEYYNNKCRLCLF